jgi:hypothetical protein
LVCRTAWELPTDETGNDKVTVSFHFAPLEQQFAGISFNDPQTDVDIDVEVGPANTPAPVPGEISGTVALDPRLAVANNTLSHMATHHFSTTTTHAAAIFNPDLPNLPDY